jgi:biopolymer transport protein ExbD
MGGRTLHEAKMRFRLPEPASMTLNLAPMVDVMMCLIIFFLLAGRLVEAQHRELDLAEAETAREIERDELGPRIVINVRPGREPATAEYFAPAWDGRRIREMVLTATELESHIRRHASRARDASQDLRCVIRADRSVPYGYVERALRACGRAGIRNVVFSANPEREREES